MKTPVHKKLLALTFGLLFFLQQQDLCLADKHHQKPINRCNSFNYLLPDYCGGCTGHDWYSFSSIHSTIALKNAHRQNV